MYTCRGIALAVLSLLVLLCTSIAEDSYEECLTINSLGNGLLHAKFDFVTVTDHHSIASGHFNLFPKSLGEIMDKYHVQELEISLTQGTWRYPLWNIPARGSVNPSGASLMAIFDDSDTDVDKTWKGLVNSIAGMTCASFNYIDETNTVSPRYMYPQGALTADKPFQHSRLRYAVLAQENVCTENLTPFKKLLPCAGKAGLSGLLAAKPLFDSHYNSISLAVRQKCSNPECSHTHIELLQTVSVVVNYFTRGIPKNDWSLTTLFGSHADKKCHLAAKSDIKLNLPSTVTLDPHPERESVLLDRTIAYYGFPTRFKVKNNGTDGFLVLKKPSFYAHRYMAGYGQEKGALVCEITNHHEESVQIVYTEYVPWFLRIYLHTLRITNGNQTVTPRKVSYSPGLERKRPYLIELLLDLPPESTTSIRIDVEKLFLKWTEFNPDANLGLFIPPAIITAVLPDSQPGTALQQLKDGYGVVRLYTEKLLIALPTPDFSMPYNVICLACTVVAIGFGSFHNLTTKIFVEETEPPLSVIQRLKRMVFGNKKKAEEKKEEKNDGKEEETKLEEPLDSGGESESNKPEDEAEKKNN